MKSEIIFYLVQ